MRLSRLSHGCSVLGLWLASFGWAGAQDSVGESAVFTALDTSLDHEGGSAADLIPECMDCGEMLMTTDAQSAVLKAGGRPPAIRFMSDVARLTFRIARPEYVAEGPSAKVQNRRPDLFEVKTKSQADKSGETTVEMEVKVNPAARDKFPDAADPEACSPEKPYNRKQKGWHAIQTSSSYETKSGYKGASAPQTTYLCVHKPAAEQPVCDLKCGEGTCQQAFTGTEWVASCDCRAGYRAGADGRCVDVNECRAEESPCPGDSVCTNTNGGFVCSCEDGKVAVGSACLAAAPGSCEAGCSGGASCMFTPTSAMCACPAGQRLKDGACVSLKQCAIDSCGPASKCTDASTDASIAVGDIRCSLPPGTAPRLAASKPLPAMEKGAPSHQRRPVDIDECKLANVRNACGAVPCMNVDRTSPVTPEAPAGAVCGEKRLPPAPSPAARWDNAGVGGWILPSQ